MHAATHASASCPSCGAAAAGRFCSECGTPLTASCPQCGAQLQRGARFCQECGTIAHRVARLTRRRSPVVAGAATLALLAVIVVLAVRIGQRPVPPSGGEIAPIQQGVISASDISNMSPRERASRLYDRVMRMHEERKADSIAFFAPMALAAYSAIPDIDDDGRYDMARIAMIAGALPMARAQRDTILRRNATHLLGLLLAADLARAASNEAEAKRVEAKFVGAAKRERARHLPEYAAHITEITSALERLGAAISP
jgi:predicted nucleic acid-binding Zn ribbon protein